MALTALHYDGKDMINFSVKGTKCRAVRNIRWHDGTISAATEGTIEYEFENLGRNLYNVRWNNGVSLNVYSGEIEIIESDRSLLQRGSQTFTGQGGSGGDKQ